MSNYHIKHLEEYYQVYRKSIREPENFWEEIAEEHFVWRKKWDKVLEWDFSKPTIKWFQGAKLNITENCIDRHLATRADKTAILFEPNDPSEAAEHITYRQLSESCVYVIGSAASFGLFGSNKIAVLSPLVAKCLSIQFSVIFSFAPSNHFTSGFEKSQSKTVSHFFRHTKCSSAISSQKFSGSRIDFRYT